MKSIENIINEFVDENEIGNEFVFSQISNVWNKNFSDTVKNNIKLVRFENSILFMHTDSAAWKKEMQLRSKEIIDNLNHHFETNIVKKINIQL